MGIRARSAVLAIVALGFAGCGDQPVTAVVRVELENASEAQRQEAARVLHTRFEQILPSWSSTVSTSPVEAGVRLEFHGEPPADETLRAYAGTQGIMRLFPYDNRRNVLMTDRDVERASPSTGKSGPMLDLTVTEAAGGRLFAYTSRNPGSVLVTTWDDEVVSQATVSGAFSRQFQTTGLDADSTMLRAVVLRSGRLPVAVRDVTIEKPH